MPMVAAALEIQIKTKIESKMKELFPKGGKPDDTFEASQKRWAELFGSIASLIINEVLKGTIIVASGIPTAGSPSSQITIAPGQGSIK